MCPYLKANHMAILKELHRHYQSFHPSFGSTGWLIPLNSPIAAPVPSEQLAVANHERLEGSQASLMDLCAREALLGDLAQVSCSETFHGEPPELAAVFYRLETALGEKGLGGKILTASWEAPTQRYITKTFPQGSATFWTSVGYHQNAQKLSGEPTYGICLHLGFSYQGVPTKKKTARALQKIHSKAATLTLQ